MAQNNSDKQPKEATKQGKRASTAIFQLFVVGFVFSLLAPWTIWFFFMKKPGLTLNERLTKAEEAIIKNDNVEAKRQILLLKEANFVEESYGGTLEYLTGVLSYREAEEMDGSAAAAMYRRAVSYLRSAEKKSLPASYLPQKAFALGVSLYRLGLVREAVPVLRVAWETCLEEQGKIGLFLAQCEMNPNVELPADELKAGVNRTELKYRLALNKNEQVLQKKLTDQEKMFALQQRVELLLKLGQIKEAQEAFNDVEAYHQKMVATNPLFTHDPNELMLLRSKLLLAGREHQRALDLLLPNLQFRNSYENKILRQAILIAGDCYQMLGNIDQAVANYKLCTILEETDEMIPASLKIANLLRDEKDQHEQSYELYLGILKRSLDETTFNNKLISWGEIRDQMRNAWKDWVYTKQFRWAMALSDRLTPLFSQDDAYEMSALVSKSWAESLQEQYDKASFAQREIIYTQVVDRWKEAGMAYSLLAKSRMTMSSYPDALWNATLMFRKGNDYEHALENIDLFLATQPRGLLPTALVLRGEILMDLHARPPHKTLDEAIDVFLQVVEEHPTDTASFRAQVNLGKAYLEQDNPEKALAVWKNILTQSALTPDAYEWRLSQYLLAKTWVNHGDQLFFKIRQLANKNPQQARDYENQAYTQLEQSARMLREFLLREKNPVLSLEAKDILATALHKLAQRAVNLLPTAETDNLKNELINEIQRTLTEVFGLYQEIKIHLQPGAAVGLLNQREQMMLKNAYFLSGHLLFELAQYNDPINNFTASITNYRDAVNYYPQEPQVLLAYYQMSNCYDRLGQSRQAKSYLEQARIILQQIPDNQFNRQQTNFSKDEWQKLLDQSLQLHESQTSSN